ncbi:hypothetical protein SERLA73DRAFT_76078 [Serpula lacrymans var. lacrymans S7.3]|uniref:Peptidase M24 domain-containing protein n=2 Tax=Serpula lacrymans var. lacrymans TaxID=341189 RepID=F8Q640_SERL3|nr:uncharacterized protein SERLADRAFT_440851 [Serpula lacrymans var. lacrymans S7.9]EGN96078.1 hypothetical protein SERLA73DRAFT_76078 [Serpula lacrymans var. lacrymans S7.3]EGO21599.1 hypothetical protein SERLADRAFT_440851 [Serpula lacrymans var. lacrymans S7.9]
MGQLENGCVSTSVDKDDNCNPTPQIRRKDWHYFVTVPKILAVFLALFITVLVLVPPYSFHLVHPSTTKQPFSEALSPISTHCASANPITSSEFRQRQKHLARILHDNNIVAYIAEPGANALFFGNISGSSWGLSERPLLLMVSPVLKHGEVEAKITILTPAFEETRARLLTIPGSGVTYAAWPEDANPYSIAIQSLPEIGNIYVDENIRHFIVDGLQQAVLGIQVTSAPAEIVQLRERKSQTELELMKCANEVTLLAIRAVQAQMYIGIRESQVRRMMEKALSAAGLTETFALVLFGENAALPHGSGSDRVLDTSDFVLIDCGGALFGYNSDVTRTFMLEDSSIPMDHVLYWGDVHAAQRAAYDAAKAGVVTAEVDASARSSLRIRGVEQFFTHRLGHGIGLEGHETPYLRGGSNDIIQTGHTFSNEPGVYIEGKVGVRLEDCFYIDKQGDAVYFTEGVGGPSRSPLYP